MPPVGRPLALLAAALLSCAALLTAPANAAYADPGPQTGEDGVNVTGAPFRGTTPDGQVRGYIDAHTHLMSYEGFGGDLLCGEAFDPRGIQEALRDCPDHGKDGSLAWFENFVSKGSPFGTHDTTGWPTFKDWPAAHSLTHQQAYYTWVERSWRAGQRILVNQLVSNRTLCELYPLKKYPCDEMSSIRLQAQSTYALQDYVDKQSGGPGKGWFRVVRNPDEARQVIEQGKLAVVLGIETSEPFGCRQIGGRPQCTAQQIDSGLDEMKKLGVSSMFVCHKFDNALCGVRFDPDTTGVIMNLGNFYGSGRFWQADTCREPEHDNPITPANDLTDLLAGPLAYLRPLGVTLPIYPKAPHCNINGLTDLGAHMVQGMIKRGMIVEVDHMSAKAAGQTLSILEKAKYSGVISGHSWMDMGYASRVYKLGGMVTSYGSPAPSFAGEWRTAKKASDPRYLFGFGYGLDANGLGPLPAARANNQANPLRYPYTSPFDPNVKLDRERTGERTWDVNTEGVANYGLVPDWLADVRNVAGPEIIADMSRGAEAYLEMWKRARTYKP
ncbi:Coagulation factor 5/8 type domain-containing protein [Actinomadura barringtoniae]|uniref:Coagulation factor 5/8 type domain-containing protein n=1 Tax=Actinomadura barringtoniae TaxID=1427535 RepID=A0A939PA10_9ACTN|nr:Coagulation factor 5/8 type domain-containing protein [Actinomadura barringtoniae]